MRQAHRQKTLKAGRVIYNLGRSSLNVRISNQSPTGARLKLDIIWPSPTIFDLEMHPPGSTSLTTRKCERIWQRGYEIGVRYLNPS